MCNEGVYAHGSMTTTTTTTATDIAVPRDSAVPTDAGCTRVCNTHHPLHTRATRTPAEPPHGRPAHFTRPPNPKTTPPKTTTPQTPTPVPDVLTRHNASEHFTALVPRMVELSDSAPVITQYEEV